MKGIKVTNKRAFSTPRSAMICLSI